MQVPNGSELGFRSKRDPKCRENAIHRLSTFAMSSFCYKQRIHGNLLHSVLDSSDDITV